MFVWGIQIPKTVFYIGDFNDPETCRAGATLQPKLEGIIIAKPIKAPALVTVRIRAIIGARKPCP
jgi:hypothetical protein